MMQTIIQPGGDLHAENARQKREIKRLNEIIKTEISEMSTAIEKRARTIEEKVITEISRFFVSICWAQL